MPLTEPIDALRIRVEGRVQGVGFRPFVHRLAKQLQLSGWVANTGDGATIQAEGTASALHCFLTLLRTNAPPAARIERIQQEQVRGEAAQGFSICSSQASPAQPSLAQVPVDRATCPSCIMEFGDPGDRRHGFLFNACTDCGPRYTILDCLPFDRETSSMRLFPLCGDCQKEYDDPADRRFHAETISCSQCGPRFSYFKSGSFNRLTCIAAIEASVNCLKHGGVLALQGIGGFQLFLRADRPEIIRRLRDFKDRPTKPFAVLVPSLDAARALAMLSPLAEAWLTSPENPIVIVPSRPECRVVVEVAPCLRDVGLLLPSTPWHLHLSRAVGAPLIVTSGNREGEPIAVDEPTARESLSEIADGFLVHDRPICRRVDDSVIRVIGSRVVPIRIARGFAPQSLDQLSTWARSLANREAILATGGQEKVAIALWTGSQAVLGPHLGDLDNCATQQAFEKLIKEFAALYGAKYQTIVHDLHPNFHSTRWATASGLITQPVQHHYAHALACIAEHGLFDRPVLALTWDGTGFGPDGSIWGGEILRADLHGFTRLATLRPFPLPGGESAIRHPARIALGLAASAVGEAKVVLNTEFLDRIGLSRTDALTLLRMANRGVQTVRCSSMGRLFDGVAALLMPVGKVSDGEAAGWLEAIADPSEGLAYPLPVTPSPDDDRLLVADWQPMIRDLIADFQSGVSPSLCAARFHNALVSFAVEVIDRQSIREVVLTGGCFVNAILSNHCRRALERIGVQVYQHEQIQPGDGGLAVGQLVAGLARQNRLG